MKYAQQFDYNNTCNLHHFCLIRVRTRMLIDLSQCFQCDRELQDGIVGNWIGCNRCPRLFHTPCVSSAEIITLNANEIYFECTFC